MNREKPERNRVITLQVEILDQKKAQWIWDYHIANDKDLGVCIRVIQEGPIPVCWHGEAEEL